MRGAPLLALLALSGCAGLAFKHRGVPSGLPLLPVPFDTVYTDASGPQLVTGNPVGKRKGEACASSVLGWVTTGDASVRAAADAGGITRIVSVEYAYQNVLGVWAKYCTIVSGSDRVVGPRPGAGAAHAAGAPGGGHAVPRCAGPRGGRPGDPGAGLAPAGGPPGDPGASATPAADHPLDPAASLAS